MKKRICNKNREIIVPLRGIICLYKKTKYRRLKLGTVHSYLGKPQQSSSSSEFSCIVICIHPLNKTMAEVAFPLATKLIEKLGSIASEQICLAWGVKADLKKLHRTMATIKDVFLDAEQKQAHNQQILSWLRQLKDVFLDAEDLLDEFECEALRREVVETFHGTTGKERFARAKLLLYPVILACLVLCWCLLVPASDG